MLKKLDFKKKTEETERDDHYTCSPTASPRGGHGCASSATLTTSRAGGTTGNGVAGSSPMSEATLREEELREVQR
jgi:hypothetical protein